MKKSKQVFAILLSGLMLLTSQPIQAGALNPDDSTISQVGTETTEGTETTDGTEIRADVEPETEPEPVLPVPEGQIPAAGENNPNNYTSLYYIDNDYELNAGAKKQLQVCTVPAGGIVTYESSNPAIATVSPTGEVTAVSGGSAGRDTAIITAKIGGLQAECTIAVSNTISLDKSKYTIYTGVQNPPYRLTVNVAPIAKTVTWTTSNKSVATVNEQGIITPQKAGTAKITATANGVSASCDVTVKKSSLTLSSKTTIYLENPTALNAKASPDAEITWKTSDKKIAAVDANGVVTPKKTGKVTISATANGITKNCVVTIQKPSITLSSKKVTIFADNMWQLQVESKPAVTIKWKSSNSRVAKVDKNGVVTGIKAGTAKITASIPGASVECKIVVKKNPYQLSLTKKTMMIGNTSNLYVKDLKSGINVNYWLEEDNGCVELSDADGICSIKAKQEGTATIFATFYTELNGETIGWGSQCVVQVINTGISQQEFSLAKGASKILTVKNAGKASTIKNITWSSTVPSVAGIDAAGKVSGKKAGSAQIKAAVTYTDGRVNTYTTKVKISNPKLKVKAAVAALNGRYQVSLKGTNPYSTVKWKTSKSSIATVSADGTLTAQKSGKATLKVTVDGKTLSCPIYITNPRLTSGNAVLERGRTAKISLSGVCKNSKITYKSANDSIAAVSKSGTVTANAYGSTQIKINADGVEFSYWVDCAPRAAIDACNTGYNIMYSSTYSQAYRMTPGYYDCSSLVFRSYGYNTALLGGASTWAPTAAGMAQYMEITGKVISYQAVDVSQLRVGDIIFYGGGNNGRYKNIYHVSMYYGGGNRLEKPLCKYYPNDNIVMIARPIK